jgi:hypothetical protein
VTQQRPCVCFGEPPCHRWASAVGHCPGYQHTSGRDTPAVVPAEPAGAVAGTMTIPPQFIIQFTILPLPLDPVSAPRSEIYGLTHRLTLQRQCWHIAIPSVRCALPGCSRE